MGTSLGGWLYSWPTMRKVQKVAVLWAVSVAAWLSGCGEESIQEQRLPKGVEGQGRPDAPAVEAGEVEPVEAEATELWVVPAGWSLSPEARPMRVATFTAEVEGRSLEVAVTRFEGEAGGILANVNRWRGQMGLAEVGQAELDSVVTRFGSEEWSGYMVRAAGADQHMLAAGVFERAAGRTWFVRASGTASEMDALEGDFGAFVRSLGRTGTP